MHPRQRNGAGNGYRSNNAMGMGSGSRISPEGSMRGPRMYNNNNNPEYNRNYNRGGGGGYGRDGHSRQFMPPAPPPPLPPPRERESDILVEAGRLAAEYLVSKGVIPPNALSGKWQTDVLKNLMRDMRGFRPHEVENVQVHVDNRVSAHPRSGSADVGLGKRKYLDEYNSTSPRNYERGRLRSESLKIYGSEMNKNFSRSGSWAGRNSRATPVMEADTKASVGTLDEQRQVNKVQQGEDQKSSSGEIAQGSADTASVGAELAKGNSLEYAGAKENSPMNKVPDGIVEPAKSSEDANMCDQDSKAGIEGDVEQKNGNENKEVTTSAGDSLVSKDDADLVNQSKLANDDITNAHSSSIVTSSEDQVVNGEEIDFEKELPKVSEVQAMDVDADNSSGNVSSDKDNELNNMQTNVTNADPLEKEQDLAIIVHQGECLVSGNLLEGHVNKEQEPDDKLSGSGNLSSMFTEKGEKRAIDDDTDDREDFKKFKEWVPPENAQFDGSLPLSGSMENQPTLQQPITSKSVYVNLSDDQSVSLYSGNHADSFGSMEEKQLFPETGKEAASIGFDLSMSNKCNMRNKNGKDSMKSNVIEIIDLEDESAPEDKNFNDSHRRGDIEFTDLDGFRNNVNNANEIPDIQDGNYGLMLSELLGNEIPNSSVPTGLNSLHDHVVHSNEEGILGDDESIYMSLGEIPISLLGPWEAPSQDYGKPF